MTRPHLLLLILSYRTNLLSRCEATVKHLEAAERVPQYARPTHHQEIARCNPGFTTKNKFVAWVDSDFGSSDWRDVDTRDDSKNDGLFNVAS